MLETMENHDTLKETFELINQRRISQAMEHLQSFACSYPNLGIADSITAIQEDYDRIASYWNNGYEDPQLEQFFAQLLKRLYMLTANAQLNYVIAHSSFFKSVNHVAHASSKELSVSTIRESLEQFVSSVALLQIMSPQQTSDRKELYAEHQRFRNRLFNWLLLSPQWTDAEGNAFTKICLLPTIDSIDQQLIVSAVTLSCNEIFDIGKMRMLIDVYRKSTDLRVRQKALIGWVFVLSLTPMNVYPEMGETVSNLLEDEETCRQLRELMFQVVPSLTVEQDTKMMQTEIMPNLFNISKQFMENRKNEDLDADELEELFMNSDFGDKMENATEKIREMDREGSDIHYSSFGMMKNRYPFFRSMCNWLMPFYPEHPEISDIIEEKKFKERLKPIFRKMAFSDSDTYTIVYVFNDMLSKIPFSHSDSIFDMQTMADSDMPVSMSQQEEERLIRRSYLRDLYRFYHLFMERANFSNPFREQPHSQRAARCLFLAQPIFYSVKLRDALEQGTAKLVKKKLYREAAMLLENEQESDRDFNFHYLCAYILMKADKDQLPQKWADEEAFDHFRQAMFCKPKHQRTLNYLGKQMMEKHMYQSALSIYETLVEMKPENDAYQYSLAVCLTELKQYKEALQLLFKLYYLHPEDSSVTRQLSWALMFDNQTDTAMEKLNLALQQNEGEADADNHLMLGLAYWLNNRNQDAATQFAAYLRCKYSSYGFDDLRRHFQQDVTAVAEPLLRQYGIGWQKQQMMEDAVLKVYCDMI